MGGPRRPCRQGGRACEHGRVGSVESRPWRLQPFPPLHAANAPHAGHRGVARGRALAGSGRRPAQRWHGAADRLPAAELEVESAAAHAIRSPPLGDGGVVPTCGTRSAPATSGWRGRAVTATSERRCCRCPPSLMPTAACRSRPVRTTGSPSAGSRWTKVCAGWPPRREPGRSLATAASKTACSASKGRKAPCRTGPLTWSPTSTGGCPTRGSRTSCSRWTTPPGSPRPSRTCEPGSPAATASVCSTCCSPRASTSPCARWPRPRFLLLK